LSERRNSFTPLLHTTGPIGRALSYQLLTAGTSIGANMQEADGSASRPDFVVKVRVALKEAKETWFRLRVCRRCDLLDSRFDPLVQESDEIVRVLATIVHKTIRNTPR
jgi:four helix bundle protein